MPFTVERDELSAPFYDAAAEGTLLIRHCRTCGAFYAPQHHACTDGSDLEWVRAIGTGSLMSWIVDHAPGIHPLLAGPDGRTGASGMIELDEGPWINAALVSVDPSTLRAGDSMIVGFVKLGDDSETIPVFTKAGPIG